MQTLHRKVLGLSQRGPKNPDWVSELFCQYISLQAIKNPSLSRSIFFVVVYMTGLLFIDSEELEGKFYQNISSRSETFYLRVLLKRAGIAFSSPM